MLYSITYISLACVPLTKAELDQLVETSTRNNRKESICSLLLYRNGHFMQTLEGSRRKVEDKKQKIVLDPRNRNLSVLLSEYIPSLEFTRCPMGFLNLSDETCLHVVNQNDFLRHSFDAPFFRDNPSQARRLMLWARDMLLTQPSLAVSKS